MIFLTGIYFIPILLIIDVVYILNHRNFSIYRKIVFVLGFIYVLMLVDVVFLPIPINKEALDYVQRWGFGFDPKSMNFIPFAPSMSIKQALQNFIMLLPLGILLPLMKRDLSNIKSIYFLILTPLLIEIIQGSGSFILDGYWKSLDINDFILNVVGALIGFCLVVWFLKKYSKFVDKYYWLTDPNHR